MTFSDLVKLKSEHPNLLNTPYLNSWVGGGSIWSTSLSPSYERDSIFHKTRYCVGYLFTGKYGLFSLPFIVVLSYDGNNFFFFEPNYDEFIVEEYKIDGVGLKEFIKLVVDKNPNVGFTKHYYNISYLRKLKKNINRYIKQIKIKKES